MLNIYGYSEKSGKPTNSDIHEKKKTILLSMLYDDAHKKDKEILQHYYCSQSSQDVSTVIKLFQSDNAKALFDGKMQSMKASMIKDLEDPSVSPCISSVLKFLLDFLIHRTV